mgnify:CR=1 FL=1
MSQSSPPDHITAERWKQLIAAGDEQAFRRMFNAYAPRLTAFAFSITRNKEISIEILDEVFIKIWKHKERLPAIVNITTYLYTATKNTAFNFLSQKTKEHYVEAFDFINIELGDETRPDQLLITSEIQAKIKKAGEGLPPKCKVIFKLVREDGLKYRDVAEILSISEKTVDAQMVIAVKRIGDAVGRYFDYFPARFQKK